MNRNYGFNEYEFGENEYDECRYGECEFEFDMDTILESTDGGKTNPYGLYWPEGSPCSREDTALFLDYRQVNQKELDMINRYILEDESHSLFDTCDMPMAEDLIEVIKEIEYDSEEVEKARRTLNYTCFKGIGRWSCRIKDVRFMRNYIGMTVTGGDRPLKVYTGICEDDIWLCLPVMERACILESVDDLKENIERLTDLLESEAYGVILANALKRMKKYIIGSCSKDDYTNYKEVQEELWNEYFVRVCLWQEEDKE